MTPASTTCQSSRRDFLRQSGALLASGLAVGGLPALLPAAERNPARLLWANLVHLGYNMWADRKVSKWTNDPDITENVTAKPYLRCDQKLWDDILQAMSKAKMNMIVIDLGEGVQYQSHPEIAVKNSWSHEKLKEELKKIRDLGLEPIPKMNFSAGHDTWLGPYHRMVSTPKYYEVCKDLIGEAVGLFDKPRFFHLGYDEEVGNSEYAYVVIRQHELWWHDFQFFADTVQGLGVRPWIWSDSAWRHPDEFYKQMPQSVLQSNWYYGTAFDKFAANTLKGFDKTCIGTYLELDKHGYDQIPTGSNFGEPRNFIKTVEFCKAHIAAEHLLGFLQTPWVPTLEIFRQRHLSAVDEVAEAIAKYS